MLNHKVDEQFAQCFRDSDFPNFRRLRLDEMEFRGLASQGFIAPERRGQRTHFKLRFRHNGGQQVRYIGSRDQASAVQAELDVLQRDVRLRRRLASLTQSAADALRSAKDRLEPLLQAKGFHFHGRAVRMSRKA